MRLLLDLPEENGYFRPLVSQPSMAAALWRTIRELRMAGLGPADLAPEGFESADKHAELVALLAAYESFLITNARGDRATVFEEALRHLDWCPIQPPDCWTTSPDVVWSRFERRLFEALPGERIVARAFALPGLAPPRRLERVPVERVAPAAGNPLAFLTLPEGFASSAPLPDVSLFHAGGAEAEIEEVFRRVLAAGAHLDEVEIVCASPEYASLVWEKAVRYSWPVTIVQGIAATHTRPGRALLALIEWIDDDFAAGHLRRMLQSGDIRLGDAGIVPAPGRPARLLVQAEAAWGRHTYRLALGRLASSSRRAAERDDLAQEKRDGLSQRAADADALAAWIDALIGSVPEPDAAGLVDLQAMASSVRAFIRDSAARASALDHVAATALSDAILELQALGAFRCSLAEALRFLRERAEGVTVAADRPRPGHLHVSALNTAGLSGRPHVFVVGLEEGRVFPLPLEDPVLLDRERARMDDVLGRSGDRTEEAVYLALVRLAAITADSNARVTLSYSCRDLREYRQTFASWVLLQAFRVVSGNPKAAFHDLHEHVGEPASIVPKTPDEALDESRWWLHGAARAGESARLSIVERYPPLGAGMAARMKRDSADFTEYDGHVPAAGAVLDPGRPDVVVSPTELEEAAECPFRHFLKRGLGVDAIESGERDRDVWLNPLLRGVLLHDLYARLLRRCRTAARRAAIEEDGAWLRNEGTRMLADLAVEMPPPSEEVRDREAGLFFEDLDLFLEAESRMPAARTPVGFEVAFGRPSQGDDEPLAEAGPVVIDVGGLTLRIAGRIDRIDRVGPSRFEIIDYKTGGYFAPNWKGTFAGGTRLQHALYGLAARELLRRHLDPAAEVVGAEYYFPSARGGQERRRIVTPSTADVGQVLSELREVIASGLFVHASREEACRWCHHGLACGRGVQERAKAKLVDARLAPFVRLAAHD
jgi:ATP-dependent helicase/nuclease subunit B